MSGLGEDTFPKSKSRPTCSWPVNGYTCSIAFVSGQSVVDSGCIAANKPTRLGVRRRMSSRRIAGSSSGEKKERRATRRRSIFRTKRFGVFFFRPRTSKKGSKSWRTPVCDCLEKETKTFTLFDNSNKPRLRARSDEATRTRCRKEKLLHGSSPVPALHMLRGRGRSITILWHSQPFSRCPVCWRLQPDRAVKQSCRNQPSVRPPCRSTG